MSLEKPQRPCFVYLRHFLYSTKECQAVLLLEHVCAHVFSDWFLLCARFTVTHMYTVDCHTYVHGSLSHLRARFTVTLMCTVHSHSYVHS